MSTEAEETGEPAEKKTRPNAKYRLSKESPSVINADGQDGLTFYYNRERRLEKAPQSVKNLYLEQKRKGLGFKRTFLSTKSNAILFFTIVILIAAIFLLSIGGYFDKSYKLEGNRLSIKGTRFEGIVIITLVKNNKKAEGVPYTGAVELAVAPKVQSVDEDYPSFRHRLFFTFTEEEEYSFTVPFDVPELIVVFQTEKSTLSVVLKPE
jgi:hypothetical protein